MSARILVEGIARQTGSFSAPATTDTAAAIAAHATCLRMSGNSLSTLSRKDSRI
jgi:hypothetical protein